MNELGVDDRHGVVDAIVRDWDKLVPRVGRLLAVLAHARTRHRPKFPIINSSLPALPSVTVLHLQVPHLNLDLQPELAGGLFISAEVSSQDSPLLVDQLLYSFIRIGSLPILKLQLQAEITGPLRWLLRMYTLRYAYRNLGHGDGC